MHIAKQKLSEKLSEGASPEPGPDGVEQDFAVAVRVSFPPTDLIVYCQRDLFLELVLMIGCVSSDPVGALKSNALVEILGDMVFTPVHHVVRIARIYRDVLERFPAHESVVADEGGAFTVADLEPNLSITHFGKISSTVLEEIAGDLVDTSVVSADMSESVIKQPEDERRGRKTKVGGATSFLGRCSVSPAQAVGVE
jgi:hypothetical protein